VQIVSKQLYNNQQENNDSMVQTEFTLDVQ